MGLFNVKNDKREEGGLDSNFLKLIAAWDNNEEWAKEKLAQMWQNPEPNFKEKIAEARCIIHKDGAYSGNPNDMYYYGISVKDFQTMMKMLVPLAENGDVDAMTSIGREYGLGVEYSRCGTPENEQEAFKWFFKAAQLGDVSAQIQVALHYKIMNNYEDAFEWYAKAAQQNSSQGYCGMGSYFEELYVEGRYENQSDAYELLMKMLDCYDEGYKYVNSEDDEIECASGLARGYEKASRFVDEENARKFNMLAIWHYWVAYDCGNPYQLKHAQDVALQNNIYVDFNNMVQWAKQEGIIN